MYKDVHMNMTVSITKLRRDLFSYAKLVAERGYEVEVEKDGRGLFKLVAIGSDTMARARRGLAILKKIGGKFANDDFDRSFFRGEKETGYAKKLGQW